MMNKTFDARLRALEALEAEQSGPPAFLVLILGDREGEWLLPDGSVWYEQPGGRVVDIGDELDEPA